MKCQAYKIYGGSSIYQTYTRVPVVQECKIDLAIANLDRPKPTIVRCMTVNNFLPFSCHARRDYNISGNMQLQLRTTNELR